MGVGSNLIGDWIDPNPRLDAMYNRKKNLVTNGNQNPERPASSLFAIPTTQPRITPSSNFYF
jgi:hypothetical protein